MKRVEVINECDSCGDVNDVLYYDKHSGMNVCQTCQKERSGQKKLKKLREESE